jgi:hypothetical protein
MKTPFITETDKAWAAGIIDGDGCVCISRNYETYKGNKTPYYCLRVTVSQSSEEVSPILHKLRTLWGGSISGKKISKATNAKRQPQRRWEISTASAEAFLRDIRPYSVAKSGQIEVAIEYRENAIATKRWDEGIKDLQEKYFMKLKTFKPYTSRSYTSRPAAVA